MQNKRSESFDRRLPGRFEMAFSFGMIIIFIILGLLILAGAFGINPSYKMTLGLILLGYAIVRFWMLKSRYLRLRRKGKWVVEPHKEEEEKIRNL